MTTPRSGRALAIMVLAAAAVLVVVLVAGMVSGAAEPSVCSTGIESGGSVQQDAGSCGADLSDTDASDKWAVLVGIADYYGTDNDLQYSAKDATDMRSALINNGWQSEHIRVLLNSSATKSSIEDAIENWLGPNVSADDTVLFFYSGHGTYYSESQYNPDGDNETDGKDEYLCFYSETMEIEDFVADGELDQYLNTLASEHIAVIIDSCFSGGMTKAMMIQSEREAIELPTSNRSPMLFSWDVVNRASPKTIKKPMVQIIDGLSKDIGQDNRVILMACDDDESSMEISGLENGVFAHYIIEGFQCMADANSDESVSAEEAFDYAKPLVAYLVGELGQSQHPQMYDSYPGDLQVTSNLSNVLITVDDSGGANYTSIQAAVDAAESCDTVYIYNGTYTENVLVNKPVTLHGESKDVVTIDGSGSPGMLMMAHHASVTGLTIEGAGKYSGIEVDYSRCCNISGNNVSNIGCGIGLFHSSDNEIADNICNGNTKLDGVSLWYSCQNNSIVNNTVNSNRWSGVYLHSSCNNNSIVNNTANSNRDPGIYLIHSSNNNMLVGNTANSNNNHGVKIEGSYDNTITKNTADANNHHGIHLVHSSGSSLVNNIVCSNDVGIYLQSSDNNLIYHNNLTDNDEQAYDDGDTTSWDNGPIIGGNYWDDYNETDPDDDGIGDTPYVIDANSQDEYPLMSWSDGLDKVIFITHAQTDELGYGTNENILIDCIVQDDMGHNVTVDHVYASIKKPDSHSEQVSLDETTTGNYNGIFVNSSLEGSYSITIHATMAGAVNDTAELSFEVASSFIDGWVVNETEIHCNEIIILNGDLTIENGGNLTLRNVILMMNCDYDGQHHIEVKDGGALYIYDNDNDSTTTEDASVITALNHDHRYLFWVNAGSTFRMKNSELHECGYEYNSPTRNHAGLWINSNGVAIEDNLITNNYNGVLLYSSSNNTLANNTINFNDRLGVYLRESDNNTVNNCNISHNGDHGVYLYYSDNNTLANGTINFNDWFGVDLRESDNNTVNNCSASHNGEDGVLLYSGSSNNILANNTIIFNDRIGVHLSESNNNIVNNCNISHNSAEGIYLYDSDDNILTDIAATSNEGDGVHIHKSNDNRISCINASSNGDDGICTDHSHENVLSGVTASSNNDDGIKLYRSSGDILTCNTVSDNHRGIHLDRSSDSLLINNIVCSNDVGIYLQSSDNNLIYHNNLTDNDEQAYDDGDTTSWDNGPIIGGNYWDDYNETDPDDDGIGDTPYVIDANSQDEYPLMSWSDGLDKVIFITHAQTDELGYGTNENILIDCIVQDDMGHNVTVDHVYASIKKPDSHSEQVSLDETTTGNYNGIFVNSSLEGSYSITIHATMAGAVNDTAELSFEVASSFIDGWVVNETEIHCNEIIILNGDLTIENGGNLTLRNVILMMNCDYDGQHHIEVKDGGALYIYDNDNDSTTTEDASVITALNHDHRYLFWVNAGSTFRMKNSELHECGYEYNSPTRNHAGLWINSNGVAIEDNLITNNYNGVLLYSSSNNTLANNTINFNDRLGVYLRESDNNTVNNCNISHNGDHGVYLYYSDNNTIDGLAAISNDDGINLYHSNYNCIESSEVMHNKDNGIYLDYSDSNSINDIAAISNERDGIYIRRSNNNKISVINASSNGDDGIACTDSSRNNLIYHNNLIDNTDKNAYDHCTNQWNSTTAGTTTPTTTATTQMATASATTHTRSPAAKAKTAIP